MNRYDISFRTATAAMVAGEEPWSENRDYDAIQDSIEAESPDEAISLALQYLYDTRDLTFVGGCEINESEREITYYDKNGDILSPAYDFRAELVGNEYARV